MVAIKERNVIAKRKNARSMTVEMLVTDFEFEPGAYVVEPILSATPGIVHAAVDRTTGRAAVTYRPDEISLARICEIIGEAGFFTVIGSVVSPAEERAS